MAVQNLQGHLLIASEKLADPNFAHTVVLIVQHDANGALGLVLNRPTTATIHQAWEQVSEDPCLIEALLFQGGPCEGPLMLLHDDPERGQLEVLDGLFFSTDAEAVKALVAAEADPIKFFVGYSGWTAGQLEAELLDGGWQVHPATKDIVFSEPDDLWLKLTRKLAKLKTSPNVPAKFIPPDPSVN